MNVRNAWNNLICHEGEIFKTVRGLEFTYKMVDENNSFITSRGKIALTKKNFEKACALMPAKNTQSLSDNGVLGPSYIWALLNDPRIIG